MQNAKILPLIGTLMIAAAAVCTYAVPRLPVPAVRKLPVDTFPRSIGEWQAGPDQEVDPEVQGKIPTALIVCRNYTNKAGESVELLLLSASQRGDFHNPNECFPGHGWKLGNHREVQVLDQGFHQMTAEKDGAKMEVLYNWLGELAVKPPDSAALRTAFAVRNKVFSGVMDRVDGMSLFVRVMAPSDDAHQQTMQKFAQQAIPTIEALLQ